MAVRFLKCALTVHGTSPVKKREGQKRRTDMDTWYYVVVSIDGDYANLRRTDIESDDLKLVARALLPAEIKEGSKLRYEMLTYFMDD